MADINWGILSTPQDNNIRIAQPMARPAPAPSNGDGSGGMGSFSKGSGGLLGGLGSILQGVSKGFGPNPVSVANQALTQQMQSMPAPQLAASILGNGQPQPGQPGSAPPRTPQQGYQANPATQQTKAVLPDANLGSLEQSTGLLRKFEGFQSKPTWDVNAYRTGYGSDTITKADGSVVKVQPGMNITKDDAERDLQRRTKEFQTTAFNQIGNAWGKLPTNTQASLTSMAYNYGSLPKNVVAAAKTGDVNSIAEAIRSHAGDNKGINNDRRMQEADYALKNTVAIDGYGIHQNPNETIENAVARQHSTDQKNWTQEDSHNYQDIKNTKATPLSSITNIQQAHNTPTPNITTGVPIPPEMEKTPAFHQAMTSYGAARQSGLTKSPYVVSVDFSQPATSKRLTVINAETGKVVLQSEVATGSTPGFSNTPNSHQSSLGTFQTTQVYNGKHGQSLRIKGLDKGINDNVEARDVVVHGADYIGNGKTGHSFGCFAVPTKVAPKLINLIKDGSIIHAYAGNQVSASNNQPVNPYNTPQQNAPVIPQEKYNDTVNRLDQSGPAYE